jgi:hypothetical protein
MEKIIIFPLALLLVSCATLKLTPQGEEVRASKNDPAPNCKDLGVVSWNNIGFTKYNDNEMRNRLRNETAKLGGNYLRIESAVPGYAQSGTAFLCP